MLEIGKDSYVQLAWTLVSTDNDEWREKDVYVQYMVYAANGKLKDCREAATTQKQQI